MIRQIPFTQDGEWFTMEEEEKEGLVCKYYEMRCLDEGLRDVYVSAISPVDLTDLMYYKLKAARLEREV